MKQFIAIISSNNKVTEYLDFDTLAEAQTHATTYGGFATTIPNSGSLETWVADEVAETLTHSTTIQARLDSEAALAIWEVLMVASDAKLPRFAEDIIDSMTSTQLARVPQHTRDKWTAKKVLRNTRP